MADAVGGSGAGGADGVVYAFDFKRGGQAGGYGGGHGFGYAVGADALHAAGAQGVGGFHLRRRRRAAAAGYDAGADVGNLLFGQAGMGDGFFHGDVGIGRRVAHKAQDFAVDVFFGVDFDVARHV